MILEGVSWRVPCPHQARFWCFTTDKCSWCPACEFTLSVTQTFLLLPIPCAQNSRKAFVSLPIPCVQNFHKAFVSLPILCAQTIPRAQNSHKAFVFNCPDTPFCPSSIITLQWTRGLLGGAHSRCKSPCKYAWLYLEKIWLKTPETHLSSILLLFRNSTVTCEELDFCCQRLLTFSRYRSIWSDIESTSSIPCVVMITIWEHCILKYCLKICWKWQTTAEILETSVVLKV